jgi:hypothetical protein
MAPFDGMATAMNFVLEKIMSLFVQLLAKIDENLILEEERLIFRLNSVCTFSVWVLDGIYMFRILLRISKDCQYSRNK